MKLRYVPILAALAAIAVAGCSVVSAQQNNDLATFLTQVNNTLTADLQKADAIALAATPVDTAGDKCALGLLTVQAEVKKVTDVANVGVTGPIAAVEMASLFQPGSAQFNSVKTTIIDACAGKVSQVTTAIAGTAGFFNALAGQFALSTVGL